MVKLFAKFFATLARNDKHPISGIQARPNPSTWHLPAAVGLKWSAVESTIIDHCEEQRVFCQVTADCSGEVRMQTVVLGADLSNNQLLLDDFFPAPATSPVGSRFTLTLVCGNRSLILQVTINEQIDAALTPAYTAEVLAKTLVDKRHSPQRIRFAPHNAPPVQLLVPMSSALKGQLSDLTKESFTMILPGRARPELFSRRGGCQICFSPDFVLRAEAQIQQLRTHRQPFHHVALQARFGQLDAVQQDRLHAFLQTYVETQATQAADNWHLASRLSNTNSPNRGAPTPLASRRDASHA